MLDSRTTDQLREAVMAAQSGNAERARMIALNALAQGGDTAAFNAFLGMLRARAGDRAGAIGHLKIAHQARPGDVTIACNLIAALIDEGALEDALQVASRDFALSSGDLRIARYRGFLSQSLERFEEAVEAYEHVVRQAPDDFESWNNLGNARSATGDLDGSVAALQRAFELNPEAPPTRLNLAIALRSVGRNDDAQALLERTVEEFPDDARALHELYVQFKREGKHEEALPPLERAIGRDPNNANLQLKFAIECGLMGRAEDARAAFVRSLELAPTLTDAYVGLAVQYEHLNQEEEFAPLIAKAEANAIDEGALSFLRALELRRAKQFEEALESLDKVPPEIEPERTGHFRAQLLDRLGRTDEAFAEFDRTNKLHQAAPSDPLKRAAELRDRLREELSFMTPEWASRWPDAAGPQAGESPVFLVGFPRSGTTLLDTILMGHPRTVVLEEKPALNYVDKRIGGVAAVADMDAAAVAAARDHYYEEIAKIEHVGPEKLLVDKSPLFLNKVPVIHRLFPNARFILALRHPCDALLSCFMSNFRLNSAMSNFLKLTDAADFYDLTFSHWERSRSLFGINVHTIVYERLVENVEAEVRPLFDFLGLDWHEDALDHQRTAKARGLITTASYSQVTEPIYKRAAGRWERYREHLEPALPTLAPWVEKFGYAL